MSQQPTDDDSSVDGLLTTDQWPSSSATATPGTSTLPSADNHFSTTTTTLPPILVDPSVSLQHRRASSHGDIPPAYHARFSLGLQETEDEEEASSTCSSAHDSTTSGPVPPTSGIGLPSINSRPHTVTHNLQPQHHRRQSSAVTYDYHVKDVMQQRRPQSAGVSLNKITPLDPSIGVKWARDQARIIPVTGAGLHDVKVAATTTTTAPTISSTDAGRTDAGDMTTEQSNDPDNASISSQPTSLTAKTDIIKKILTCSCFSCCPFARPKTVSEFRTVIPNHTIPDDTPSGLHPNAKFADNKIKTTKYSLLTFVPKNLFEQFHRFANIYFVTIVVLNWMPGIEAFGRALSVIPILFVLSVTAVKDIFEDWRRYRSDRKINNSTCRVWSVANQHYARCTWRDVRVGDFVHVGCNEIIPADILLLRSSDPLGICYVETSNLDGESNLKQRQVISSMLDSDTTNFVPANFTAHVHCEHPNNQIYRFNGFILHPDSREPVNKNNLLLRGCEIRNTDFVEGIVVYAGRETKAMLNNSGPRYKRSELERLMNWDIVWCVVLLLVMCLTGAAGSTIWLNSYKVAFHEQVPFLTYLPIIPDQGSIVLNSPDFEGFLNFWTYVIVLQVMIPISLYVTIEIVKLGQIYFIVQDSELYHAGTDKTIQCRALNIPEELGQIQYVLSDKTGTLTENSMIFRRCSVAGVDYGPPPGGHGAKTTEDLNDSVNGGDNVWDVTPNPDLYQMIYNASIDHFNVTNRDDTEAITPTLGQEEGANAFEFMLNMAICNTVVVNSRHHHDNMNASGNMDAENSYILPSQSMNMASMMNKSSASATTNNTFLSATNNSNRPPVVFELSSANNSQASLSGHQSRLPTVNELPSLIEEEETPRTNASDAPTNPGVLPAGKSGEQPPVWPSTAAKGSSNIRVQPVPPLQIIDASPPSTPPPPDPAPSARTTTADSSHATSRSLISSRTFPSLRPNLLKLPGGLKNSISSSLTPMLKGKKSSSRADSPAPPLNPVYEAESPDELSLVHAAAAYGMRLLTRQINRALVELPSGARMSYDILHTMPFDSDRKCMSVIVRAPHSHKPILYVKGADASITRLLSDEFVNSTHGSMMIYKSQQYLSKYSSYGLRTLCLAKRELEESEYHEWAELQREAETDIDNRDQLIYESALRIERNLELLGVTGIEDRLQDGVPECIAALRHAGIKVWVLTGDKIETAVNIAYASRLFSPGMELLQLKANSLEATCDLLDIHVARLAQRALANMTAHSRQASRSHHEMTHSRNDSAVSTTKAKTPGGDVEINLQAFGAPEKKISRQRSNSYTRSRRNERIGLVVDGRTLAYCLQPELEERFTQIVARCTSVLCCRTTPLQKASVVRLAKEKLKGKTLAIGDGANDVSMIQCADVGIGISGQEGMQAVMASDFALARFRFLRRLLLVHGHWCYDRLARTVLYFFYKNALFVFTIFWYQLFCGFSGQVMIDQIYLMFYNLLFTSIPPILLGIFDQSAPDQLLIEHPKLYAYGRYGLGYRWHSFWINMLDSLWQSVAVYFTAHFTFYESEIDMWSFGFLITSALVIINQLHLAIEVQSWTLPLLSSIVFSISLFFGFAFVYHEIVMPNWGVPDLPVRVNLHIMADSRFWLCIMLIIVLGLLPRLTTLTLSNMNRLVTASSQDVVYARYTRQISSVQRTASTKPPAWKVWWNKERAVRIMPDSGVVLTTTGQNAAPINMDEKPSNTIKA